MVNSVREWKWSMNQLVRGQQPSALEIYDTDDTLFVYYICACNIMLSKIAHGIKAK